jgi:hypothetical protein
MMNTMADFGNCPCGGRFETKFVEIQIASRNGSVTLRDIPQGHCRSCGSHVYRPHTLIHIENAYQAGKRSLTEALSDDDRGSAVL